MNHSTKCMLLFGIVGLVLAGVFAATPSASAEDTSARLSDSPALAAQVPTTYSLSVTISPSGGGSVTQNPPLPIAGKYLSGTVVSLTAVPTSGWKFDNWGGELSGTSLSASITMTANRSVTANFSQLATYALTVNIVGTGTVAKNPNQSSYAQGSSVQLTATPGTGWRFGGWSGGGLSGSANPTSITMDSTKVVTATFIQQVSLTVNVSGSGTVAKSPSQTTYDLNSSVQLTAYPSTGWQFTGWSGGLGGTTNPATLVMNDNKNVTANFTQVSPGHATSTATSTPVTSTPEPTVTPWVTITPLFSGLVGTVAPTVTPITSTALPSTGGSPLLWIAAGLVLVLVVIGARYLRQSST